METKVNVQGGTIQLPDGTTGYFKSEYVKNCSNLKLSHNGAVKYDIQLDKNLDGRCLVFHNNDLNEEFVVPLSDQIEDYGKKYLVQIVNPLVIENNSCIIIITFSVNSSTELTKYQPALLYKMTEENSSSCLSYSNQVTVFSALLKIEKFTKYCIPVCVSIMKQNMVGNTFVNDIGGGGNGDPPVAIATIKNGRVVSLQDIQTGKAIETSLPTIIPSLSTVILKEENDKTITTLVYRGKVQAMMKWGEEK